MNTEDRKLELIENVINRIRTRMPGEQAEAAARFVANYYQEVDPDDLAERSVDDLYGAVLSHWHFIQRLGDGLPKLRVYNPNVPEHGWQSSHTIIEILNDDMPFLVDSIVPEVNRQGLTLHLIIHPVMRVVRDENSQLIDVAAGRHGTVGNLESLIHLEVDRRSDAPALDALQSGLARVLADVRAAVEDWPAMRTRLADVLAEINRNPPPQEPAETAEDRDFLQWIADNHFTLLGYRQYDLEIENGVDVLRVAPDSGLGILRGGTDTVSGSFATLPPEVRAQAREQKLLILAKSNARATVHRQAYLDYIGVKRFNRQGEVIGEHRFLGLFTYTAYNASLTDIPLLRRKVNRVMERAGFLPNSHGAKALAVLLEQYPRDELFQIDEEQLYTTAMGILRLGERQKTRLFVRRDPYGRFFSCLIFVPRDRYNTELREQMQDVLMTAFAGISAEFSVQLSESMLARVLMIIHTPQGSAPEYDVRELEQRLAETARLWEDKLIQALIDHCGEELGNQRILRYGAGFPAAYRETVGVRAAVYDIDLMETLAQCGGIAVNLYVLLEDPPGALRFRIYHSEGPVTLSASLPMLEHMGVRVIDEQPYCIARRDASPVWIHDFGLRHDLTGELPIERLRTLFHEAFLKIWRGEVENDNFNRLVLVAGLDWRQVKVLRAYGQYLRQIGFTFSRSYVQATVAAHPAIVRSLIELFEIRFDPNHSGDRAVHEETKVKTILEALDQVENIDDDRILRQFLALIRATLRTNYYRRDEGADLKHYLSFKFDPKQVPGLPEPRPMFEIFVFSPRIEGIHLRGGHVARGGLRWSDRMEDFRTEVLGLVKAQVVKNAVIVPTGSKGGFVIKRPPPPGDRDALLREGIACYQTYLHGLLDITDNLVAGHVSPPPNVVRHDSDDAYLVVAADKGTATFSDTANAVAREYGFWLDDAFASGGSAGYDHKKMGITARGAWESVKRHFRELGLDTQSQDFTVVGIGDMSGDVFGNGMLRSRHIRLVAAFDHRHIFIDPNPDPETSFIERERIFALPRSSWADYDGKLISKGGGVWPRSAKLISLSTEARRALGIDFPTLTSEALIRAILKAPVDLLYNGGIGTYAKAADESHAEVGDRANDAIRVNGAELRCRVIGEGGNLGFTQRGRIEFAMAGGRAYTDAIDNSAGVDCSDHEVNIKILLNIVEADGELTRKQRDQLLAAMTDEVAALVLRDNIQQTQILSVMASRSASLLDEQTRYMRQLEKAGRLNRALEYLPDDEELAECRTAHTGLTLPELSVLLAYSKLDLYDAVIASDAPEDPLVGAVLESYFPTLLRERFPSVIARHPLRREIIATCVINEMINRVGSTFAFRLTEETGASAGQVLKAYTVTRDAYRLSDLWQDIETLDTSVPAAIQNALFAEIIRLAARSARWFLRRPAYLNDLAATVTLFAGAIAGLSSTLDRLFQDTERGAFDDAAVDYVQAGVTESVARRVVSLLPLYSALDIAEIAASIDRRAEEVATIYFELVSRLDLLWFSQQIRQLPTESHWQMLARDALRDELSGIIAELTVGVFRECPPGHGTGTLISAWETAHHTQFERYAQMVAELRQASGLDMPMVSVALRELRGLTRG